MKHFYIFLFSGLMACSLFYGCTKGPSDEWFAEEGWTECILEYGNPSEDVGMEMDMSGNIKGINKSVAQYTYRGFTEYKFCFFSSMDELLELTEVPTNGYTDTFLCEKSKCGISRRYHESWDINTPGKIITYEYYLFYISRINEIQLKVFYKEKPEWYEYLLN